MKKIFYKASALFVSFALITPLFASAQSVAVDSSSDVTSQIQSLVSQISSLESELHSLVSSVVSSSSMPMMPAPDMGTSTPPQDGCRVGDVMRCMPIMPCTPIDRDLSIGSQGSDVQALQQMLSNNGFFSASTTGFFGPRTAQAVEQFQSRFGIASSSTGFVGSLTRNFLRVHCGMMPLGGQGGSMGSSTPWMPNPNGSNGEDPTPMMWNQGSTTPPMRPQWNQGSSTGQWMGGQMGSSTPPQPCSQDDSTGGDSGNAAAVAAALFVPHAMIPGMMRPCVGAMGEMQQQ